MTSTTSDARQQKPQQSLTFAASPAVAPSLCDEEASSAAGESRDTPIWISDDESVTEDEDDDEGRHFDNSQSRATPTTTISTVDYLDITGYSPDPPPDPVPNQRSPCQTNFTSAGDTAACIDASFDISPTSPDSQPRLGVSDEQQLATGASSEPGIMTADAISDQGPCQEAQSPPDPPSVCTHYPHTASPVEEAQPPLQENEAFVGNSCDDGIPEAGTLTPVRYSPEPYREQDPDDASCASRDAESEAREARSGPPFGARVSPPSQELPSQRRSRRRSSHAYETVQDKDSNVDTEGSGSEDGLGVLECVRDEDYCPSPAEVRGHGSGDDSDDEEQHGRKRRRVSQSPHNSVRSTPASARSPRQRRSTRRTAELPRGRRMSICDIKSQTLSQARPVPSEASTFLARFKEWPFSNVLLKCITEGNKATF
ncbi:uncharacterized protein BKA55DRAFT_542505 [Fusarium redolens]|uniref:Uncharacterized protein n=1 Tax=Fusarium redolens TaxID=48865 RepID=A0A9P9K0P1_FUSRE|nr:uncharacterized protein BKA55DRAFT_542505 [Fusarium redolens]KAH7239906.1 hypothetical protein BKA55DRAFT_542505 [Fusarium redolens]